MTNGEKIKELFPNAEYLECKVVMDVVFARNQENWFDIDWWKSEYKEPTTKNDLAVEKTDMIDKSNFSQEQYKADLQSAYDCGYEQAKNDLGVDCISRKAVLDLPKRTMKNYFGEVVGEVVYVKDIMNLPSVTPQEPKSFKWCTDCKEYDQEKHCCHRYSKVIRDTVAEIEQEPKTGHWIIKDAKEQGYDIAGVKTWYIEIMCSECGFIKTAIEGHTWQYHYCLNCGARMIEPQESEE